MSEATSCTDSTSTASINLVDNTLASIPEKVIIWLRPTGNAPILKQSKFKISPLLQFQAVIDFLRRQLHYTENKEPLFLYLNSSFSPTPDEPIVNLYRCFNANDILVINYSITPAWG